jgi:hypothetical protein
MTPLLFDAEKHEYRTATGVYVPNVTKILAMAGICDFSFVEEEIRVRSMDRGQSVHWMTRLEDEGALDYRTVPIGLRPYRKAWLTWKKASGFVPELIESPFISHFGYAGTIDRYGSFPKTSLFPAGSKGIVDLKTGNISDWVRYQLAAYSLKIYFHPAMARTVRRIAIALRADGTYGVREFPASTWESDFATFMKAKRETDAGHVERDRGDD